MINIRLWIMYILYTGSALSFLLKKVEHEHYCETAPCWATQVWKVLFNKALFDVYIVDIGLIRRSKKIDRYFSAAWLQGKPQASVPSSATTHNSEFADGLKTSALRISWPSTSHQLGSKTWLFNVCAHLWTTGPVCLDLKLWKGASAKCNPINVV